MGIFTRMVHTRLREHTDAKRFEIYSDLKAEWNGTKLRWGAIGEIARKHGVHRKTVEYYWKLGNDVHEPEEAWDNLKNKKKGNVGRKKLDASAVISALQSLPIRKRRTYRHAAAYTPFSSTGLWNAVKRGYIVRRSSFLKPSLSPKNKRERIEFCLGFIDPDTREFHGMHNRIHVDEKWFYLKEGKLSALVGPEEGMPSRNVQSRRFITKVMFLAAVARPRFDKNGNVLFDGKIGIWAFTEEVAALRSSKNRLRGTLELKPINVDTEVYREKILKDLLPAIKSKWPDRRSPIYVQQDGAPAHVADTDMAVVLSGNKYGWNINLDTQPANSPDFNVLDLGLFNSIQSTTWDRDITDIRDLVQSTEDAYYRLDPHTLNNTFLSLQNHMECSMKLEGGNHFKAPHMNKERRRRSGEDIETFTCSEEAYHTATTALDQSG